MSRSALRRGLVCVALGALAACGADEPSLEARGADGEKLELLARGSTAVALVFVAPDCPISNRYAPEINRLAADYSSVAFFLVYTDTRFSVDDVRRHRADYELSPPALIDFDQRLREHTGVEVTPEAALLDSHGALLYRGRIDDRFVDFGVSRPEPTRRDLRRALDSLEAGVPIGPASGPAVGCYIVPAGDG